MDNFTAVRNGLDDHFDEGKFTPYDMGVYYVMLRHCDWDTGIWKGSAAKIVATYGFRANLRAVQRSMQRLRNAGMINYRSGTKGNRGRRGNYPVLIHHYKPQKGAHSGKRLKAFALGSLENPVYEPCVLRAVLPDVGGDVVSASIQDNKIKEVQDRQLRARSVADAPSLPDWVPQENWQGFAEMRTRKDPRTFTPRAQQLLIMKLAELRDQGQDPAAVLDQSVALGWTGLFPIKGALSIGNASSKFERAMAAIDSD